MSDEHVQRLRILGIETSCDETSVALLDVTDGNPCIVHHETSSQIEIHERYGGVVPEVAARTHVAEILALLDRAKVFVDPRPYDLLAVTQGPGLPTALRVGIETARTMSMALNVPIIGVNHLEGHLASAWLTAENRAHWEFPILALMVSGGHTEIVLMKDFCRYKVLGRTRDDAAGEAFDKTAKMMGLAYPGGPLIAKLAENGDPKTYDLPRPMWKDPSFDFSFSGLKTAVRYLWESLTDQEKVSNTVRANLAASIQQAIVDVLVEKTIRAALKYKPKAVCIVGGVSANLHLQETLRQAVEVRCPDVRWLASAKGLHTDNAAMIAAAGYWRYLKGKVSNWRGMEAKPEWSL